MLRLSPMKPCLINSPVNNKALSLLESLIAVAIAAFLVGAVLSFHNLTNRTYLTGVPRTQLQSDANVVLAKILAGTPEPGGIVRLCEAVSCQAVSLSELRFKGLDGITRSYRLNGSSTAVIYNHPTASGMADEVIYTAPAGCTITLRFTPLYSGLLVNIDVAVTKGATSGSVSTNVNLRNHIVL